MKLSGAEAESEVDALVRSAESKLIPTQSKQLYLTSYNNFITWQESRGLTSISQKTCLAYFEHESKNKSSSTLWSVFSMLKKMIKLKHNINIGEYSDLIDLLKMNSKGHQYKKARTLQPPEVEKFLVEAPDDIHLATKVNIMRIYYFKQKIITVLNLYTYLSLYKIFDTRLL